MGNINGSSILKKYLHPKIILKIFKHVFQLDSTHFFTDYAFEPRIELFVDLIHSRWINIFVYSINNIIYQIMSSIQG